MITAEQKKAILKKLTKKQLAKFGDAVFMAEFLNQSTPALLKNGLIKIYRGKVKTTDLGLFFLDYSTIFKALA